MPKKTAAEGALFVRLPATAVGKLDRAAEALGMRKKDLVAGLVSKYVDPDSRRGLSVLGSLATHKVTVELGQKDATVGAYSFQPYDSPAPAGSPPEVLNAEQAGELLQNRRGGRAGDGGGRQAAGAQAGLRPGRGLALLPRRAGAMVGRRPKSPRNRRGDDQIFARYRGRP